MKLPGQLQAEYALKGVWLAAVAAVVIVSLGFGAYQYTMRHGFHVLFWKHEGDIAKAERLTGEIKAILDGQAEAERLQKALNDAKEQAYKDIAEKIDDAHDDTLAAARSDADRYIAANRVRPQACGRAPGQAAPAATGAGAGVPAEVPAETFVAVSDADVQLCSAAAAYAHDAHNWAVQLNATNQP